MIGALQVNPDMIGEEQLTLATLRQGLLQVWWKSVGFQCHFLQVLFCPSRFLAYIFVIHPRLCLLFDMSWEPCQLEGFFKQMQLTFAGGFLGSFGKHGIWAVAYCYGTTGQGLSGGCRNVLQSIEAESSSTLIGWTGWTRLNRLMPHLFHKNLLKHLRSIIYMMILGQGSSIVYDGILYDICICIWWYKNHMYTQVISY